MNPISHGLASWAIAVSAPLDRRQRNLVVIAGVAADFDGFGVLIDMVTKHTAHPTDFWTDYHHILGHNLGFGLFLTAVTLLLAGSKRLLTAILVFAAFNLHIICDIIGARGPDGYQWPIPYLEPFSNAWQIQWAGQWQLDAWQNIVITCFLLAYMFYMSWKTNISPLSCFSDKWNRVFVATIQNRFGKAAVLVPLFFLLSSRDALACGGCVDKEILWYIPAAPLFGLIAFLYFGSRRSVGIKGFCGPVSLIIMLVIVFAISSGSLLAPMLAFAGVALLDLFRVLCSVKLKEKKKLSFLLIFIAFWVGGFAGSVIVARQPVPFDLDALAGNHMASNKKAYYFSHSDLYRDEISSAIADAAGRAKECLDSDTSCVDYLDEEQTTSLIELAGKLDDKTLVESVQLIQQALGGFVVNDLKDAEKHNSSSLP